MNSAAVTQIAPKHLAGVLILAGGLSTRMGTPKALLPLPTGDTLLTYHVNHARQLGVPVLIADNGQDFKVSDAIVNCSDIRHVLDYQPQRQSVQVSHKPSKAKHSAGPLGAILMGMQQVLSEQNSLNDNDLTYSNDLKNWLMVISCDSLVNAVDVWDLWYERYCLQVVNKQSAQKAQQKSVQPQIYCLADNERDYPLLAVYQLRLAQGLQNYLDAGERRVIRFIQPVAQSLVMPESWYRLSNLNTPAQFHKACQQLFG